MFKICTDTVAILLIFSLMIWMLSRIDMTAEVEVEKRSQCMDWERWAREYKGFYLTPWQKEQCDAVGVKINAPVRKTKIVLP